MNVTQRGKGTIIDILLSDIRVPAALASFVLSLWVVYLDQNINLDGILYMRLANMILEGDWQTAYDLYTWLFYPALIAMVSKISGLGLEGAAYFLDACLAGFLSYVFISLVQEIGGTRKIIAAAALVIVFCPELNESSSKVIRGHGYWPFYLLSLLFFMRFYKAPRWRHALSWNASIIVATLFRIEGIVFIALLPFILFWPSESSFIRKLKNFVMAHFVNLVFLALFCILQATSIDSMALKTGRLKDILSVVNTFWQGITVGIFEKADIIGSMVLNKYSDDYAVLIVLLIPVVIFVAKLINVITPLLCCLLFLTPFVKSIDFKSKGVRLLLWAGVINVVIVFTFLLPQFFLQGRYVVGLALTLLVFLPFVLTVIYEKWEMMPTREVKKVGLYYLLALLLVVNAGEVLVAIPGASSKKYIKEAGLWMKENIPATATVYSNNNKIIFYSGHIYTHKDNSNLVPREDVTNDWLEQTDMSRYDYLALRVKHDKQPSQEEIAAALGTQPLRVFQNKRKDKVLVFKGNK